MNIGPVMRKFGAKFWTEVTGPTVEETVKKSVGALLISQSLPPWPFDMLSGKAAKVAYESLVMWALECLEEVIRQNNQLSVLAQRAKDHLLRGEVDAEITILTEAIEVDPNSAWAYYLRGLAHLYKALVSSPRLNEYDLDRAHADLLEARRLNPTRAVCQSCGYLVCCHVLRSQDDFEAKDYHRAIMRFYRIKSVVSFDLVVQVKPLFQVLSPEMGYRLRAIAYVGEEKLDRVIGEASRLLQLCSKDPLAYFLRGFAYAMKSDYKHAIADLSESLKIDPEWGGAPECGFAHGFRGAMYKEKEDLDRAIADFSEALRLDPQGGEYREQLAVAHYGRGARYKEKGDLDRAIADFSEALRLDPQNEIFPKILAAGGLKTGSRCDGARGLAYFLRGTLYANKKDYDHAIADFSEAYRLDPRNDEFREALAIAFKTRGIAVAQDGGRRRLVAVYADLTEALRLGLDDEEVRVTLKQLDVLIEAHKQLAKSNKARVDKSCQEAITATAVDARRWLSTNSAHPLINTYTNYAERFYKTGAIHVWFDDFGNEDDEDDVGVFLPQTLIIELPRSEREKQKLVEFFTEQSEKEDFIALDDIEDYVGERYCRFTIYLAGQNSPGPEDIAESAPAEPAAETTTRRLSLDNLSNYKVVLETAILAVPTLHVGIKLQNLAYDKVAGIVFTTDNWATVRTAYGAYSSTVMNGLEVWQVAVTVGSATEVKFAVFYRVAGSEYWDNNFGRNYKVTPSHPQRWGDAP